jgi:hypothetical protein
VIDPDRDDTDHQTTHLFQGFFVGKNGLWLSLVERVVWDNINAFLRTHPGNRKFAFVQPLKQQFFSRATANTAMLLKHNLSMLTSTAEIADQSADEPCLLQIRSTDFPLCFCCPFPPWARVQPNIAEIVTRPKTAHNHRHEPLSTSQDWRVIILAHPPGHYTTRAHKTRCRPPNRAYHQMGISFQIHAADSAFLHSTRQKQMIESVPTPMQPAIHVYEVRPRRDKRGFDLISDALRFD